MQIGAKAGRKKFGVQTECNTVTKLRIREKGCRRDSNPRPRHANPNVLPLHHALASEQTPKYRHMPMCRVRDRWIGNHKFTDVDAYRCFGPQMFTDANCYRWSRLTDTCDIYGQNIYMLCETLMITLTLIKHNCTQVRTNTNTLTMHCICEYLVALTLMAQL